MEEASTNKNVIASQYTGSAIVRGLMNLVIVFGSLISLFLLLPALTCWKERYECRHTYIDGKQLCFDGHALQLLGKFICWVLLTVITLFIYSFWLTVKMKKWKIKHTHFVDSNSFGLNNEANGKVKQSKTEKIESMTEEERAAYDEKVNNRRRTARLSGIISIILCFIMPPWGFIFGIVAIVTAGIYREKTGIRLGTVTVSIVSLAVAALVPLILRQTAIIAVSSSVAGVIGVAACIAVFVISRKWESYQEPKTKE